MISNKTKKILLDEMAKREDDAAEAVKYYKDDIDSYGYRHNTKRRMVLQDIIDSISGKCPKNKRNRLEYIAELCYEKCRLECMIAVLDAGIEEQIDMYAEELDYGL